MPGPRYCEPCRRLISRKVQFIEKYASGGGLFIHHPDANSLKESLKMYCAICSLAYRESFQHQPILHGTSGYFRDHHGDSSMKVLHLYCDSPNSGLPSIIFVPRESMLDYCLTNPLSSRTDSSSALEFLLGKYRDCKDTHVGCRPQKPGVAFPPLRVIDVGETTSSCVHLRNTQCFTDASYICLSYCWDKTQPLLLTKQTEAMLYNGISASTLPKTLHDAVCVTRILGIRYLWIASLCIFQDNEADWSYEASRMRLIYSQAVCTIAATSAENSAGGLFFDRNPEALQPLCVEFTDTLGSNVLEDYIGYPMQGLYWCDAEATWTKNVENAPLTRRAWVCQERHWSSRIIHFTKHGLFWECHEYKASENYPNGIPEWLNPFWCDDQTALKRKLHRLEAQSITSPPESGSTGKDSLATDIAAASDKDIYFSWCQFRIAYSRCNLTMEADKLVAIQGIAEHMSIVLGDQLIAGLWRNHLLEDLCWHKFEHKAVPCELTRWRAPTWSWASTTGTIWVSLTYRDHMHCPGWRSVSEINSVDVKSKLSGELEHATLKLRCRPISALFELHKDSSFGSRVSGTLTFTNSKVQMLAVSTKISELKIYIDGLPWEEPCSVLLVILQQCLHQASLEELNTENSEGQSDKPKEVYTRDRVEGLLLVSKCGFEGVFQRVGVFMGQGVEGSTKILREHEVVEETVITLV